MTATRKRTVVFHVKVQCFVDYLSHLDPNLKVYNNARLLSTFASDIQQSWKIQKRLMLLCFLGGQSRSVGGPAKLAS